MYTSEEERPTREWRGQVSQRTVEYLSDIGMGDPIARRDRHGHLQVAMLRSRSLDLDIEQERHDVAVREMCE